MIASGAGAGNKGSLGTGGFTLLEVMVVVAIMAAALTIVAPRLIAPQENRLKNSAAALVSTISYLNDQAINEKSRYLLHLDLATSRAQATHAVAPGNEQPLRDPALGDNPLQEGVTLEDVVTAESGCIKAGTAELSFGPGGLQEGVTIHLKSGERRFTVIAYPYGSRVEAKEGYWNLGEQP